MKKPLVFIDVETTGGSPSSDRITEVGLVRVENNKKVAEYQTLLNPGMHIPFFIQQMTGINQKMVDNAPYFEEIKGNLKEMLEGATFVAHNARFDYSFIRSEFQRFDDSFSSKILCTVRLSRALYPHFKRHSLESLIHRFSLTVPNRHRAFDDAHALWEFYQKAQMDVGEDKFMTMIDSILKGPRLPSYLKKKNMGSFPETPGVYRFYGRTNGEKNGELLYIGKSTSLKKRIYSHFTAGHETNTSLMLSNYVKDIQITQTAGELGALLLEAHEIKKHKPLFNKSLRKTTDYIYAVKDTINDIDTIRFVQNSDLKDDDEILMVAHSMKNMKNTLHQICEEYSLCPKLLKLENSKHACFASQIGKCKGICNGNEATLTYNIRFAEAFAHSKIPSWPYNSPVAYQEQTDSLLQKHIFNKWCHIATYTFIQGNEEPEIQRFEEKFDWDIYKIVKRFLRKPRNMKVISLKELQ